MKLSLPITNRRNAKEPRFGEATFDTQTVENTGLFLIFFGFFTASVQRCGSHQSNEKPSARFWINEIVRVEQQWRFILTSWPGNESELMQI